MSLHDQIRQWFTGDRRRLIRSAELDRLAGRPVATFSRFLANDPSVPLTFTLSSYLPALALVGFVPVPISPPGAINPPICGHHRP